MSKKQELHVVINIDTVNISHGNAGLLGSIAHLLADSKGGMQFNVDDDTSPTETPDAPTTTATQPAPTQDDDPQPQAPAVQKAAVDYTWPQVGDELIYFESAQNLYNNDDAYDLPEIIEVTDDWFRVRGVFESKTGKGTRSATLKVSRAEVADGSVKYAIY